jgi:hypothetical protein
MRKYNRQTHKETLASDITDKIMEMVYEGPSVSPELFRSICQYQIMCVLDGVNVARPGSPTGNTSGKKS